MNKRNWNIMGLFQKRVEGDDALLELARARFEKAGMGAEVQGGSSFEIERELGFAPRNLPVSCHLPREINLMDGWWPRRIITLAEVFHGRLKGFIVHDQWDAKRRFFEYLGILNFLNEKLCSIQDAPMVFIEYAAGLDPDFYYDLLASVQDHEKITGCIDIGHLGIWYGRKHYHQRYSGQDITSLHPFHPLLSIRLDSVQEAVSSSVEPVVRLASRVAALGKPLHFHLHDCHPLSTFSPYGVSDHLSFHSSIPLPFSYRGMTELPTMYGKKGLTGILRAARNYLKWDDLHLSLEIHPVDGRRHLGDYDSLFCHWRNKTNAERMNHWLEMLVKNGAMLHDVCEDIAREDDVDAS